MYRTIIVGYNDSEEAKDALALGRLLAPASGAELVLAGVFAYDPLSGGHGPAHEALEREQLAKLANVAEATGAVARAVPSSSPAHGLHDLAEEMGADLVLVGSSHRDRIGQILAGSVGLSLLHGSPCPVGVAPRGYAHAADRADLFIVVGIDGSPEASLALSGAVELARAAGVGLHLVGVVEPPTVIYGKGAGAGQGLQELERAITEEVVLRLKDAKAAVSEDVEVNTELLRGDPAEVLAGAASRPGGLLMVGSRGYGPVRRVLLGSVGWALMRAAVCPVIVHPRGTGA